MDLFNYTPPAHPASAGAYGVIMPVTTHSHKGADSKRSRI